MSAIAAKPFNSFDPAAIGPRWMNPCEVVYGTLHNLEELEGDCLASIADLKIILPAEIGLKIQARAGKRIGIIKLDRQDYRLKLDFAEAA